MKTQRVYKLKNGEMSKFFYVVGMLVIIMSCGKDIDLFIPRESQAAAGDISRLKSRLQESISQQITYTLQVPCQGDKAYEVDKDVIVVIPPDFVDLASYPCINGSFSMEVTVCDTKGEIMIAGIPTISESTLLESRVELRMKMNDGTHEVKLAHGKKIRVLINDPDPRDRMELFYGNHDHTEWLQADNDPEVWDNVTNSEWTIQQDSQIITGFGYECFSDSTDWINVDAFFYVPESQRTDVCVELPEDFTNTNTQVFMAFDNYNSIVHLPGNPELKNFCEYYGSTPIGFDVTFIVIAEMGEDRYLLATKKAKITEHHSEKLQPLKTPFEEIKNYLLSL